jgi:hypothetical protein
VAGCSGAIAPTTSSDPDAASKEVARQPGADDAAAAQDPDAALNEAADAEPVLVEDDAADTHDSAWHGCYGAPPARLERVARRT